MTIGYKGYTIRCEDQRGTRSAYYELIWEVTDLRRQYVPVSGSHVVLVGPALGMVSGMEGHSAMASRQKRQPRLVYRPAHRQYRRYTRDYIHLRLQSKASESLTLGTMKTAGHYLNLAPILS